MFKIQTIKTIFRPTIVKIVSVPVFFVGINFFVYHFEPVFNNSFLFPSFNLVCGQIQKKMDENSLNSYSEEIKKELSSKELLGISDNWIPVILFCILPLRIIYYYIFICVLFFLFKIFKKTKFFSTLFNSNKKYRI